MLLHADNLSHDIFNSRQGSPYDAIVVGSGAAGGVACHELTHAGLRVLVLEAGWEPTSPLAGVNAPSARLVASITNGLRQRAIPPVLNALGMKALSAFGKVRQPVQSRCFAWKLSPGSLVDDRDCPYETAPGTQFNWFRSRQLGGRMTVPGHGRQYYRMAEADLGGDRHGRPAWPLDLSELEPFYAELEQKLRLRGGNDSSAFVPDSLIHTIVAPRPDEAAMISALRDRSPELHPVLGRYAPPPNWVAMAAESGRLTLATGAIVDRVRKDRGGNVTGVDWIDRRSGTRKSAEAPIVFLCASAFESTRILLMSRDPSNREGIGMHSDALGRFVMDHAVASCAGYVDARKDDDAASATVEHGRCIYVPAMAQAEDPETGGLLESAFGMQLHRQPIGDDRARIDIVGFAPMLPRAENRVRLSSRKDRFGVPILTIDCRYGDADRAIARCMLESVAEAAKVLGIDVEYLSKEIAPPGTGIHECGTARMGSDPSTSVVDANGECWDVKGLYVTDAAALPSLGIQNPTLTIMALSARAAAHASGRRLRREGAPERPRVAELT
ncbi:GMC family oxidoreductase [Aureimonas altamirensis]|uniref:GMC oxidoreductase n=1 Tax=Aureimonas altamirensis TaxID=370622 RepID=UPI002036E3A2|nr:GMC family oxidoreductase [Aureimonas altamirensis]MCM2504197.1 GMC family oxidoreductase [Aureimonas altamirensis]